MLDIGRVRMNVLVDYEILGSNEYQAFDPLQGNYTLEASVWSDVQGAEVGAVFHHVSRHLGDRPKTRGVAWNVAGLRLRGHFFVPRTTFDLQAGAGWVTQRAFVDYKWTSDLQLQLASTIVRSTDFIASFTGEVAGIEPARSPRRTQMGGRIEIGIRLRGRQAALDVVAGYERRIDAYQLEQTPRCWTFAGVRIRGG